MGRGLICYIPLLGLWPSTRCTIHGDFYGEDIVLLKTDSGYPKDHDTGIISITMVNCLISLVFFFYTGSTRFCGEKRGCQN